ncbi:MAG: hypothetical protein AAF092_10140 [Pseudomonadota bacterium]
MREMLPRFPDLLICHLWTTTQTFPAFASGGQSLFGSLTEKLSFELSQAADERI